MELLDSDLLAPIRSILFSFEKKKDGQGGYKAHQTLRFYEFKQKIRPLIRNLCVCTVYSSPNLAARYFWCAYDLVRKRRANHIQSWRLCNCPKDLCYGGREAYIKQYGDPWTNNALYNVSKKKRKRKRRRKLQYPPPVQPPEAPAKRHVTQQPVLPATAAPAKRNIITQPVLPATVAPSNLITQPLAAVGSAVGHAGGDPDPTQFDADPFDDNNDNNDVFRCVGCQHNFSKGNAFPQGNKEWASPGTDLRCRSCFDMHTREKLLPEVNDEVALEDQRGQKKKKRKRPCRCGATTHSMVTSKLCRLNKRYNRDNEVTEAVRKRAMAGAARRAEKRAKVAVKPVVADTPPKPPAVADSPPLPVQRYQVGDNVYAQWSKTQCFLGQVIAYKNHSYDVYFLFGKVKKGVSPSAIRLSDSRYPTRRDMVGKEFFFEGAKDLAEGRWKVRQLVSDKHQYRCTRLTGTGANVENFDIGYVIKQYMKESDSRRESGWAPVLSKRTRRGQPIE